MIKKYNTYIKEDFSENVLRYSIFDWDENILFMSSVIHLDRFVHGEWVSIDIPTSQFNYYISSEKTRMRNGNYHETFIEQSDTGPRGDKAFLLDTIKAIKNKDFGPSWEDFIYSLIDGRIFLIITARGHEPNSIRKAIEWIIYNYLSDDQLDEMKENLMRFHKLFGDSPSDIIEHYLDKCDYVGIMSDYFRYTFDVPDMKMSQLVGHGKSLAIKRFIDRIREYSKKVGLPAKVGFSDDRSKTVRDVGEFLSGEKSWDVMNNMPIDYYIFDTSGKDKKKIRI